MHIFFMVVDKAADFLQPADVVKNKIAAVQFFILHYVENIITVKQVFTGITEEYLF